MGVMTLTDVWYYFNRARGVELVSPDDLLRGARLFESDDVGVRLRVERTKEGVLTVVRLDRSPAQLAQQLAARLLLLPRGEEGEGEEEEEAMEGDNDGKSHTCHTRGRKRDDEYHRVY